MNFLVNTGLLMSVVLVLGTLFDTAIAQDQNAQTAGKLAGQISASLMQIIKRAEDPASQTDAVHEKSATVALSELRRLAEDIDILERLLRNGKSLDQTLPHYESIAFRRKECQVFRRGYRNKGIHS